jgi:hypothetical protein
MEKINQSWYYAIIHVPLNGVASPDLVQPAITLRLASLFIALMMTLNVIQSPLPLRVPSIKNWHKSTLGECRSAHIGELFNQLRVLGWCSLQTGLGTQSPRCPVRTEGVGSNHLLAAITSEKPVFG